MRLQSLYNLPELVAYVQLVRVEEKQDQIAALGEPTNDVGEDVGPSDPLLLARKDAGGVNDGNTLKQLAGTNGSFELVEVSSAELREAAEGKLGHHRQGVPLYNLLLHPMDHGDELVRRRLGPNVSVRIGIAQQVAYERRFPGAVLPDQQYCEGGSGGEKRGG